MCNKKMKKIFSVILLLFFLICAVSNFVFATDNFNTTAFDTAQGNETVNNATKQLMATGIGVIRTVGVGISIIMLSYIGIKYMMASANERAEFKKSMFIYVMGAVFVFAATNILTMIVQYVEDFKI